jgi:hypothetical protein
MKGSIVRQSMVTGFLVLAMAGLTSAQAADSSSGCGLGWQLAPKTSLISSTTRLLVNATFSSTIAMTLGTSGCAQHSIVKNEFKGIHYAEANRDQLMVEMARGQGEYVDGLAAVFGCQDSQKFGSMVQDNYEKVLPSEQTSGPELYHNVKAQIKNHAQLSHSCRYI